MIRLPYIVVLIVFLFQWTIYGQTFKNNEERLKYANQLFEQGKFVEAEKLFLESLSIDQLNPDLNFKYGVCLLYASEKKDESLRFLRYAVSKNADPRAHFYLGKALHLNYRFKDAIEQYKIYKSKSTPADQAKLQVDMHIKMCENGRKLMSQLTELVVENKQRASIEKFYVSYDLSQIGGRIIVFEDFQSKYDKKVGYRSVIYFPPNNQDIIFYSSYGKDGSNGLDLYSKRRLPNGDWGEEQILPPQINTPFDEAYGFLHADQTTFYFCSKGHNSMGGYDVFKCTYNKETNSYGPVQNLDYKINTPDDDIMYVVDSLERNAYFASSRAARAGFVDVYKVRVETYPMINVILAGKFNNEINPGDIATIKIEDTRSEEIIGVYSPNQEGKYVIVLPKSGTYNFIVETKKSKKIHTSPVVIPPQMVMKPLKQRISLVDVNNTEKLIIQNLFDEEVEDAEGIMAEVLNMLSNPQINAHQFEDIEGETENPEIFANDKTFDGNFTSEDLLNMSEDMYKEMVKEAEEIAEKRDGAFTVAAIKSKEADEYATAAANILKDLEATENPLVKQQLAVEAKEYNEKARDAGKMATSALSLAKKLSIEADNAQKEAEQSKMTYEAIKRALDEKNPQKAQEQLVALKDRLNDIINKGAVSNIDITSELAIQAKAKKEQANTEFAKAKEYRDEEMKLTLRLNNLIDELARAKEKDKAGIQRQIEELKEQIEQNKEWAEKAYAKAEMLDREAAKLAHELSLMEDLMYAIESSSSPKLSVSERENLQKEVVKNDVSAKVGSNETVLAPYEPINVQEGTASNIVGLNNTTTASNNASTSTTTAVIPNLNYTEQQNELTVAAQETDPKLRAKKENEVYENWLNDVNEQLQEVEAQLSIAKTNEDKEKLSDARNKLLETKTEIVAKQNQNENVLAGTTTNTTTENSSNASTSSSTVSIPDVKFTAQEIELSNLSKETDPLVKAQKENELYRNWLVDMDEKLKEINRQLSTNIPESDKQKLEEIAQQLQDKKKEIERKEQLNKEVITKMSDTNVVVATILDKNFGDYIRKMEGIEQEKDVVKRAEQQNELIDKWINEINQQLVAIENQISTSTPSQVKQLQDKEAELKLLKRDLERKESENESTLASATKTTSTTAQEDKRNYIDQTANPARNTDGYKAVMEELSSTVTQVDEVNTSLGETGVYRSQDAADVLEANKDDRSKINQLNNQLETLEEKYEDEKKSKKREKISEEIGEIKSEKNTLEASYGEKVFQADAKELDYNDAQLSAVFKEVRTYNTDYLLDENYIKANYLLKEAENQRKQAEDIIFKAQSAQNDDEKSQLYAKAHQVNTAALQNQRDALQLVEEMRSPGYTTQYVDASLAPKDVATATTTESSTSTTTTTPSETTTVNEVSNENSSTTTSVATTTSTTTTSTATANTTNANTTTTSTSTTTSTNLSSTSGANISQPSSQDVVAGRIAIEDAAKVAQQNAQSKVKDQQVGSTVFTATKEPESTYEVVTTTSPENIGKNTAFSSNAVEEIANQNTKSIEKIDAYNQEIAQLNRAIENASTDKEKDKLIKQLNAVDAKRAKEELKVVDDYSKATQLEMDGAKASLITIADLTSTKTGYQKEQADAYRSAGDDLVKEATDLRREAAKEKDKVEQADLYKEAITKEKLAATYYEKATALQIQHELAENSKSIQSMEVVAVNPNDRRSTQLDNQATEIKAAANAARNEAADLFEKAAAAKKPEDKANFTAKAEIAENKAQQLEGFSSQLRNQANEARQKEEEIERKNRIMTDLKNVNTEDLRATETYERYFEVQESILAKTIDLAALEGEKKGYENLATQQEIKAKDLENKAANTSDKQQKSDWLSEAAELKEMAIANRQKAKDIQMTIDEIDAFLEGAIIKRNGIAFNLSESEKENYEALSLSAMDKAPIQKKGVITFGDLIAGTFKPDKVDNTLVVFDEKITYSDDNPIPINPGYPDGLFYKVQVGAFSKPIANDVFKGFAPITAENLPNSNLIRYRVGYFNGFTIANDAKNQIRQMGYSDAFVVAIFNGQQITLSEARSIERGETPSNLLANSGSNLSLTSATATTNTSTNTSTTASSVANTTTTSATTTTTSTVTNPVVTTTTNPVAAEIEVDLGAGTARTNNADRIQGLFYTVQLGAYSKPIDANSVFNISPLVTKFVGNLYKYSTGIYRSVDDAVVRKNEVNRLGLTDAFVTVYYNGERISIERANQLIAELGEAAYATDAQGNFKQLSGSAVATPAISATGRYQIDLGTYAGDIPVDLANAMLLIQEYTIQIENIGNGQKRYYVGNFNNEKDAQTVIQLYKENGVDNLGVKDLNKGGETGRTVPNESSNIVYKVFLGSYKDGNVPQGRANTFLELSALGIVKIENEDGETYFCGNEKTYKAAQSIQNQFTQRGVSIAEIRAYQNGQSIPLNQARTLTGE